MALNIHVLPQAGVVIGVLGSTEAPVEVHRHANQAVASGPAREQSGISARFRLHDLRHTAAALMIQAGYPPKLQQEIPGHASITTTLDLYGHLYPGDMDRYADRPGRRRRFRW
jgi:integrase